MKKKYMEQGEGKKYKDKHGKNMSTTEWAAIS